MLGGLHDRSVYTLLNGGGTGQIRFGSLFNTSAVDATTDTITFPSGTRVLGAAIASGTTRAAVRRSSAAGAPANSSGCGTTSPPIAGRAGVLRAGDQPDDHRPHHHLRRPHVAGTDAPVAVTPIDATHVKLPATATSPSATWWCTERRSACRSPRRFVNVTLSQRDVNGTSFTLPATNADGSTAHDPTRTTFSSAARSTTELNDGDALTYTLSDPTGGMGLTSGTTYYVIKTGDGYTIRLAVRHCEAVGPADPAAPRSSSRWPLTLTGPDSVRAPARPQSRSTGRRARLLRHELQPGQPWHHARHHARRAAAHPRRDLPTRCSPHRANEVDLIAPAVASQQAFVVDLTHPLCVGLRAVARARPASRCPPSRRRRVTARRTRSRSAAAVPSPTFPFPKASLSGTPSVSATVAGALTAGLDVKVVADSTFAATATPTPPAAADRRRRRHRIPRPRHRRVAHHDHAGRVDHRGPRPDAASRSTTRRCRRPDRSAAGWSRMASPTATPGSMTTPRSSVADGTIAHRSARTQPDCRLDHLRPELVGGVLRQPPEAPPPPTTRTTATAVPGSAAATTS